MIRRFQGSENRDKLVTALRSQKILRFCHDAAELFADGGELMQFAPGEVLIHDNADDTHLYLIICGTVDIVINGHHYLSRFPGEHVGEMALIDPTQRRSAQVRAKDTTVVHRMTEAAFTALARQYPDMWRQLALELADRLRQRNKLIRPKNPAPIIFLGSSSEGLPLARAIAPQLAEPERTRLWTENVFQPSEHTMESLERQLDESDFGILVLSPDDIVKSRNKKSFMPRDNVIFELGLFMGRLGRRRAIMVIPAGREIKIPSDLFGITIVRHAGSPKARKALGQTVAKIQAVIQTLGCRGI